jgi:NADH-quinone oxidoreductase subunit L
MGASALGAIIMAFIAYNKYVKKSEIPQGDGASEESGLYKLSYNKLYIDELYDTLFVRPLNSLSKFLHSVVEKAGIDGLINGIGL